MKPFRPPPARVTRFILIVCICLQLAVVAMGQGLGQMLVLTAGLVPARLSGEIIGLDGALPPALTLLTHMFLHGGLVHLVMNMVFLTWIGRQVEWLIGPVKLAVLFLVGGVAGGLLHVMIEPDSVIPVVGASGAISAIFAAYALLFASPGEAPANILGLRLSGETVRALRYAALWVGLQLLTAVAFNTPESHGGGIAIWSHIGGFLAGLLFALPWMRRNMPYN